MRISRADVDAFAAASADHNPLHTSDTYSRRTPFGEPVVFGVLGALRLIAAAADPAAGAPTRVHVSFARPLFVDRDYVVDLSRAPDVLALTDSGDPALWLSLTHDDAAAPPVPGPDRRRSAPRPMRTAAAAPDGGRPVEPAWTGQYACDSAALRRLAAVGDGLARWSDAAVSAMAWSSYLAGMEVPGAQALLTQIDVRFSNAATDHAVSIPFYYDAAIERWDTRFGLVTVGATLRGGDRAVATTRVRALSRPPSVPIDVDALARHRPTNHARFAGRTAVVVGGSRGLGAAIAAHLALSGATTYITYAESGDRARLLESELRAHGGALLPRQGDARDARFWDELRAEIGAVDLLACSAWPPMNRLSATPAAVAQAGEHLVAGFEMTALPLLALLPVLRDDAEVLALSSHLVTDPDPAYWHYATGKAALEGLCAGLAPLHPGVRFRLARPLAVATDYVNAAAGRRAAPAGDVARILLEQVGTGSSGVQTLDFDPADGLTPVGLNR